MQALILNGFSEDDAASAALRAVVAAELRQHDCALREFILRDEQIAYCAGCFGCWVKTPGECVVNDAGRAVSRAFIESDLVIFLTPVTFGGYSPELKKALDRLIPILSPFFTQVDGETHHVKRYARYPRLAVLGLLAAPDSDAARVFTTLVSRNAINMNSPAYAVDTLLASAGAAELKSRVADLLTKVGVA